MHEYTDDGQIYKAVPPSAKRCHLVTHDESTFNANDGAQYLQKKAGSECLRSKSKGKGVMVSEFLFAAIGRLFYYDDFQRKRV